ncbi:MAG TPA: cytochrome P450 [Roseiflexaceae bacterium]|nr:cytochrome P450 [Roseiflexaceae bacterium]
MPRQEALKHFAARPWGTDGEEHRVQRKLVLPAFHRLRIAAYRDDMVAITQSVLNCWRVGEQVDVAEQLRHLTARVATKTLFGEDIAQDSHGAGRTVQAALATLSQPLTTLLPYDLPGLPYHRFLDLITRFDTQMRAIIQRKRAAGRDDGDVLSTLIQAHDEASGATLDEDELLAWVGSLFGASHETSSLALTWTLLLLSQHPQVAADLWDELTGVLGGAPPTVEQLTQLPLLERVIKESMRLIPPAPFTWRYAAHPTQIGGYPIPQGTEVYTSIYQTHHMPELYAERFNPRRWETIEPGPWEYLPFSAGPRMCIGAGFAMMEIKIVLALLLQRYRMQFVPKLPVDRYGIITIGPKHGLPMIVHRQDRNFAAGVGGVRGNVREMVELPN